MTIPSDSTDWMLFFMVRGCAARKLRNVEKATSQRSREKVPGSRFVDDPELSVRHARMCGMNELRCIYSLSY